MIATTIGVDRSPSVGALMSSPASSSSERRVGVALARRVVQRGEAALLADLLDVRRRPRTAGAAAAAPPPPPGTGSFGSIACPPRRRRGRRRRRPRRAPARLAAACAGGGSLMLMFELVARPVVAVTMRSRVCRACVVGGRARAVVDDRRRRASRRRPSRAAPSSPRRDPATPRRRAACGRASRPCALTSAPLVEQRLDRVGVAGLRREVQRLHAGRRHRVRLAAGVEQPRRPPTRVRASSPGAAACSAPTRVSGFGRRAGDEQHVRSS